MWGVLEILVHHAKQRATGRSRTEVLTGTSRDLAEEAVPLPRGRGAIVANHPLAHDHPSPGADETQLVVVMPSMVLVLGAGASDPDALVQALHN